MYAANYNYIEILEELVLAGADWNIKTKFGTDFITILSRKNNGYERKQEIIDKFPDEYKMYLIKKSEKKYNL